MASGVKVDAECKDIFAKIKDKHEHGYAVMKIKDKKEIVLDTCGCKHEDTKPCTTRKTFDEMRAEVLACEEPRYILVDLAYDRDGAGSKDVVVYIYWCPDCVPIGKKMVYAASNDALKKAFTGIKHFECHDDDEFSYANIAGKLQDSDRA